MKSMQKGFTLIELMIVVAIIGILAAIAIPQYQDYTIRSKLTEALNLAAPAKLAVAETYASNGSFPADNTTAGIAATVTSKYVSALNVANGVITVTVQGINPTLIDGGTITLTPDVNDTSRVDWACSSSLADKYLPANCRTSAAAASGS
jgi:type IV pilus assembly protein PilA